MSWLKRILIAFAALVLLLVIVVAVVVLTFDPNAYKQQLEAGVHRATGRELTLAGDIELSLFPWLGLRLGEASLSNAPGFGEAPFARVQGVAVHVELLPLLRKEVRVDRIELRGLALELARDASGRTNWDDLLAAPAEPAPAGQAPGSAPDPTGGGLPVLLTVGGVELVDAQVHWRDAQAGTDVRIAPLNLRTGRLEPGEPTPVKLDLRVALVQPAVELGARLETQAVVDLQAQRYALRDLRLQAEAQGEPVPGGALKAALAADVAADLAAGTARVDKLSLETLGLRLGGTLSATGLAADPVVTGRLETNRFDLGGLAKGLGVVLPFKDGAEVLRGAWLALDLTAGPQAARVENLHLSLGGVELQGRIEAEGLDREAGPNLAASLKIPPFDARPWLAALESALPPRADEDALGSVALEATLTAAPDSARVQRLVLAVDQSRLTGTASVQGFERPAVDFDLALDRIDLDRYLPPPPPEARQAAPVPVPAGEADAPIDLPVETLRGLDVDGRLRVGRLTAMNLNIEDLSATLSAHDGLLALKPLSMKLYQGRVQTVASLDLRGKTPVYRAAPQVEGLALGPLLQDYAGDRYVTGTLRLAADLATSGERVSALRRGLNGKLQFALTDVSLRGSEPAKKIAAAIRVLAPAAVSRSDQADIGRVSATASVSGGVADNRDLVIEHAKFTGKGEGKIDLGEERMDYRLNLYQSGERSEIPLPVRIKGPFADLKVDVDEKAWAEAWAKKQVERKLEKEKKKLEEKLEEKLKLDEKAGEILKKGLKDLFR